MTTSNDSTPHERIGQISPQRSGEIPSSYFSIGAETMDRDYPVYEHWRDYLVPLGVTKARLQAGWEKTEIEPGVYD